MFERNEQQCSILAKNLSLFNLIIQKSSTFLVLGSNYQRSIDHCKFFFSFCFVLFFYLPCAKKYRQKTIHAALRAQMVESTIDDCSHFKLDSNRKGTINTCMCYVHPTELLSNSISVSSLFIRFVHVLMISRLDLLFIM